MGAPDPGVAENGPVRADPCTRISAAGTPPPPFPSKEALVCPLPAPSLRSNRTHVSPSLTVSLQLRTSQDLDDAILLLEEALRANVVASRLPRSVVAEFLTKCQAFHGLTALEVTRIAACVQVFAPVPRPVALGAVPAHTCWPLLSIVTVYDPQTKL